MRQPTAPRGRWRSIPRWQKISAALGLTAAAAGAAVAIGWTAPPVRPPRTGGASPDASPSPGERPDAVDLADLPNAALPAGGLLLEDRPDHRLYLLRPSSTDPARLARLTTVTLARSMWVHVPLRDRIVLAHQDGGLVTLDPHTGRELAQRRVTDADLRVAPADGFELDGMLPAHDGGFWIYGVTPRPGEDLFDGYVAHLDRALRVDAVHKTDQPVQELAVDGSRPLALLSDGTVVDPRQPRRVLVPAARHGAHALTLTHTADGIWVAGGEDEKGTFLRLPNGRLITAPGNGGSRELTPIPGGVAVVQTGFKEVWLVSPAGRVRKVSFTEQPTKIAVSGGRLYVVTTDPAVNVVDVATGRVLHRATGGKVLVDVEVLHAG